MQKLLISLFLLLAVGTGGHTQVGAAVAPFPSPEEFVNEVFHTVVDSTFSSYYLIRGADTCRFVKYDFDEWTKYYLQEPVSFNVLNELSEKAYLSRYPYFWKQDLLLKAVCITHSKADSLFTLANPALEAGRKQHPAMSSRQMMRRWQQLSPREKTVFSFSLPQFTDDGQYAVIDLNVICGVGCGSGLTCIFRHTTTGWKLIGRYANW